MHVLVKQGQTYDNIIQLIHTLLHFYDFIIMQPRGERIHTFIILYRAVNAKPVSSHLCSPDSQLFPADQLSKVC